jgi:hypothetical protein
MLPLMSRSSTARGEVEFVGRTRVDGEADHAWALLGTELCCRVHRGGGGRGAVGRWLAKPREMGDVMQLGKASAEASWL